MDVCAVFHVVLSRKEKEKRGWAWVGVGGRGKCPGAPPHINAQKQADRKVSDRPIRKAKKKKTRRGPGWCLSGNRSAYSLDAAAAF
jgi:hypothetical protein